jgi:hypothetical protein
LRGTKKKKKKKEGKLGLTLEIVKDFDSPHHSYPAKTIKQDVMVRISISIEQLHREIFCMEEEAKDNLSIR